MCRLKNELFWGGWLWVKMEEERSKKRRTLAKDGFIDFTAGSLGGIALVYVGQPFDTIKVKMQTFPEVYTNMVDCFKQVLYKEGISRGLYAGTIPALAANVAENSILFLGYGFCQKVIKNMTGAESVSELSTLSNATAGCLAAFGSSLGLCPTELIKCKLQAMRETALQEGADYKRVGPFKLTADIIRKHGFIGMFQGLVPTIAREMPGYFFFFGGYEGMRELLRRPDESKENIGVWRTMLAGAVGGVMFWTIMFPVDVIKSRVQISSRCSTEKEGLFKMLLYTFRNEGIGALYNGLGPTVIRTIPATAVLFLTYEYSKKFLHYVTS